MRKYIRTAFWNNQLYHPSYLWFIAPTRQTEMVLQIVR